MEKLDLKKKVLAVALFSAIITAGYSNKAEASVFTDLTDNKLDQVEKRVESKKDLLAILTATKDETTTTINFIQKESSDIDKAKDSTQSQKDLIAKEIETMKAQIKAAEEAKAAETKATEDQKASDEQKKQISLALNVTPSATTNPSMDVKTVASGDKEAPTFGSDGLLVEKASPAGQNVINMLLAIPGRANGKGIHAPIDAKIDQLSTPEAIYVIHRIEGAGFGQTGSGLAGSDTSLTHQAFIRIQVNGRFGGSVHNLLKSWGTYSYSGY